LQFLLLVINYVRYRIDLFRYNS